MILFIALCYGLLVWLIYFKLELLPYNKMNRVISTVIGIILLSGIAIIVLSVTPYSKNMITVARVNAIAPRISGEITKVFVEPGEVVNKGKPLFELSTRGYDIRVSKAKGNLQAAKAAYEKASKQRDIALQLEKADPDSISLLQLINTDEELKQLRGSYEAAASELDKALHDLSKTTVYAPTDGFTPYVAFEDETTVSAYAPVLTFVSTHDIMVSATYPQNALANVRSGDKVEFILDVYPGQVFSGEVEKILWASGEAQVFQGQTIPDVDELKAPKSLVVKIKPGETSDDSPLKFSMSGHCVIYTQKMKPFHIIQKIHLRMQSWLNYIAL